MIDNTVISKLEDFIKTLNLAAEIEIKLITAINELTKLSPYLIFLIPLAIPLFRAICKAIKNNRPF